MNKSDSDPAIIKLWGIVNNKHEKPKKLPLQLTTLKGEPIDTKKVDMKEPEEKQNKKKS